MPRQLPRVYLHQLVYQRKEALFQVTPALNVVSWHVAIVQKECIRYRLLLTTASVGVPSDTLQINLGNCYVTIAVLAGIIQKKGHPVVKFVKRVIIALVGRLL